MPTALELLETEICDDILVVDLESRSIIIPKNVSVLGVEADDETRILHFKVPRHYCEVDLAEFAIRVNYKNAKSEGDMYIVTDAVIEDDWITFDWVVGRHAFTKKGNVVFNVCLKDVFEGIVRREFNTTVAILPVLEGLETGEEIAEEHLDIFEQLREEFASDVGDIADAAVNGYINEHIDEIKGPPGESFKYEDFTTEQLEDLKGPPGDPGSSIQSIVRTFGNGAPGTTDTYTITMTDGRTATFQVYNGKDGSAGSGSGDMLASMYDPQAKRQDIFQYVDNAITNMDLPDDVGDMRTNVYDPQAKRQDIFQYVDDAVGNLDIPDASGIPNLGENITEGYANDTVAFWAEKGSGQAWFSAKGMLVNQPAQYGFVISYTNGTDVFQMFSDQNAGVTYFRYGDGINNWFKHWTTMKLPGMATTTELGLVMVDGNNGIGVNTENGNLFIKQASNSEIDGKEHSYKPITPDNLDYAVKSALTNNANELSDAERASALGWIGAAAEDHTHDNLGGSTFYEATIGTNWTENEDTGVKSQTIQITGVTDSKNAHVEPRYTGDGTSDGYAAFVEQKNQFFTCVTNGYAETVADGITFHIFGDVNTMSIPVLVEVK